MADITVDDQYLTFDGRLASFQKTKKRGSTAGGRGAKAQNWPHKTISPESLARAGFFFLPFSDNPDNVVCFLCEKSMDGWEEGDDPLREHLKHSPGCGWAIVAAIEAEMEGYWREDPSHPDMVMARKATFAGRWPHENKRGWKCKTKQLVESGWKYTPTPDSDDMTTCTYCQLAMDGWEADDKPKDEHYKRSPNCAFFALVEEHKQTKKATRTKAGRGSKASRLSTQSAVSIASEPASVAETVAAPDDSVVTTTSVMTQGGTKKTRAKKAPAAKGKKAKSKKEELAVQEPVVQDGLEDQQPPIEESPVAQPSKAKRGKKRPSTAIEEPSVVESEAPATKKRATRKRGNTVVESSAIQFSDDESPTDVPVETKAAPAGKKGRVVSAQKSQKAPVVAPVSSPENFRAPPGGFPDDDEIERQLEAELEAPLTEDEEIAADSDSERSRSRAKASFEEEQRSFHKTVEIQKSESFAMLDPHPAEPDEDEIEDELEALRAEMEVAQSEETPQPEAEPEPIPDSEPEAEPELPQLQVPKKGRKAGTRKASKQAKPKKAQPAPEPEPEPEFEPQNEPEPEAAALDISDPVVDEPEISVGSTGTVIQKSEPQRTSLGKRGRGRPSKHSLASQVSIDADELAVEEVEPPKKRSRGRPSKTPTQDLAPPQNVSTENLEMESEPKVEVKPEPEKKRGRGRPSKASLSASFTEDVKAQEPATTAAPPKRGRGRPPKQSKEEPALSEPDAQLLAESDAAEARILAEAEADADESVDLVEGPESIVGDPSSSPFMERQKAPTPRPSESNHVALQPSTPATGVSPAPSARQAALSPSQSPQSSDAENQPPSSKPAASARTKRVVLAPVEATPVRGSPSRRNMVAGLQSKTPWKAVDIDTVMGTPHQAGDKENGVARLLRKGKDLTSPEKKMTVEEWIYFNAGEAEKLLKQECEAMVSSFESEGSKAMNVLEDLVVE
ncbi:unnamed protein product [Clonostachys rhizophaga]|uniref:Protein bir1 n=1 Tax=Clonostachys rhizophaga TaxID=160324 RepID=A0A9N9YDQ4_9HYPO|nr:unnamed protein product [Clonostachys rhizophaga]